MVDQIWSISPVVYAWYFTHMSDYHPRLIALALLISVWGARLTYNFYRKGGYNGEEDYRWPVSSSSSSSRMSVRSQGRAQHPITPS